jgi:hypothetical protein
MIVHVYRTKGGSSMEIEGIIASVSAAAAAIAIAAKYLSQPSPKAVPIKVRVKDSRKRSSK